MIDWLNSSDDIWEAREIGRQDMQREIQELQDELDELNSRTKNMLVIAYSTGYENGHHDTVEGTFDGDGQTEIHDYISVEWIEEALADGTFDREIKE